jgi:transposase
MDRDSLKLFLDQGLSLEEIGKRFGRHPSTVGYWVKKHGLRAANKERHAARGPIPRERLAALIDEGYSLAGIARILDRSVTTVRHWAKRYALETSRSTRVREGREGRLSAFAVIQMQCGRHGLTDFWLEGRGSYRCMRCRVEAVTRRRAMLRTTLLAEAGGSCAICGYSKCAAALHFHHLDPGTKRFNVRSGNTRSLEQLRREARKCVLLCSNCHAEVESGVTSIPARVSGHVQDLRRDEDVSGVAHLLDPG